jgi:hypothetical protein
MDLSNPEIEIRPRPPWEAVDLGCLMARRWFAPLCLSWLVTTLPVFVAAALVTGLRPLYAVLLFWWLKPLFERLPLWVLSQAIFGRVPALQAAVRDWRRIVQPQLVPALTYRRGSASRSFDAAVIVLEQLDGAARQQRLAVLHREPGGTALWLTWLCAQLELLLLIGCLALIAVLIPHEIDLSWWTLLAGEPTRAVGWIVYASYAVVATLVGPFYVAGGFSLYLHRRIELEAWDVEIGFRRLVARWQRLRGAAVLVPALALLIASAAFMPVDARAGAPSESAPPELWVPHPTLEVSAPPAVPAEVADRPRSMQMQQARERIEAVLGELAVEREVPRPRRLEQAPGAEFSARWLQYVAETLRVAFWAIALALAVWLVLQAWRWQDARRGAGPAVERKAARVFVRELVPHAEPAAGLAAARALWRAGRQRAALALLLQASLERLVHEHGCRLAEGDTETDCLRKARSAAPAEVSRFLARLVATWQHVAYAHRAPDPAEFEALCEEWPQSWR